MAAKARTIWRCQQCGAAAPRWLGRCNDCGEFGSLVEEIEQQAPLAGASSATHAEPVRLGDVGSDAHNERFSTGGGEPDIERVSTLGEALAILGLPVR